ncbi:gamma-glutamyltransferase family protein [Synoicihabitans lomoniglobus]|uniref:Gamma-glutamyltransferase n=1 Tax=Synoicihabitans lomoniglobus TaxID=2909285 RepID=A0AAF0CQ91_9BACT|nr:gamma-glutamyltransferase [Opitutaceae bacterium LMO-M01]WED66047.1 gamma-glutamyltransferase [Opitutaceae bacterium LMO-M01]
MKIPRLFPLILTWVGATLSAVPPVVDVIPVTGRQAMVVAGHPEATAIGVEVLRAGGNAADAAIAVSLALGVAEPYGSGLGGKLMLLYHHAATGQTYVVDAMDAAPVDLDETAARQWTAAERTRGYTAVAVPGLPAGLAEVHARWATREWGSLVEPARALAERGFRIEPKTRTLFEERRDRLEGDPELASLFLPGGDVPAIGTRLPNPDLARSLAWLAEDGPHSFYEGRLGRKIADGVSGQGGFSRAALAAYAPRITGAVPLDFAGYQLLSSPPPSTGAAMFFPVLKVLEPLLDTSRPLRSAYNLDLIARAWGRVQPRIYAEIADRPDAMDRFAELLDESYIAEQQAWLQSEPAHLPAPALEDANASTTHFVVVDREGNVVTATQSLSLHFGSGRVAPGTGIVLNNSMSNFAYRESDSPNFVAAGQRPRSTICPTLILGPDGTIIALGLPGGSRIPTAMLQVVLDRVLWQRTLDAAIGDVRVHINPAWRNGDVDEIVLETGLSAATRQTLTAAGWTVKEEEDAGTGLYFGGINAIEIAPDGTVTGYADPRRTNFAAGF